MDKYYVEASLIETGPTPSAAGNNDGNRWPPPLGTKPPGPRLNIKTVFPRYGDSHVKDKTVGETVLSLTWESLYW